MNDPLSVECPYCGMPPGWGCNKARNAFQSGRNHGPSGKPHAARVRAAEREERGKEKGGV